MTLKRLNTSCETDAAVVHLEVALYKFSNLPSLDDRRFVAERHSAAEAGGRCSVWL